MTPPTNTQSTALRLSESVSHSLLQLLSLFSPPPDRPLDPIGRSKKGEITGGRICKMWPPNGRLDLLYPGYFGVIIFLLLPQKTCDPLAFVAAVSVINTTRAILFIYLFWVVFFLMAPVEIQH